jgi:hypothetical protein
MRHSEPSLNKVYSFVEKSYLRKQAGDVLERCLDAGSTAPLQRVVEELVLAGPQSLTILREMLAESTQRKSQVLEDMHQVYIQFALALASEQIQFSGVHTALAVARLSPRRFVEMLRKQGIDEQDIRQVSSLQLLNETRLLIKQLAVQLHLLEDVERYLADWVKGVVYDAVPRGEKLPIQKRH